MKREKTTTHGGIGRGVGVRRALGRVLAALAVAAGVVAVEAPAAVAAPYGPYTCKNGFVWREAVPGDQVCVTPQIRDQAVDENAWAPYRREPNGGAWGPNTCKTGFVWRLVRPNDLVCVPPASRDQAYSDNVNSPYRLLEPASVPRGTVWVTTTQGPFNSGGRMFARGSALWPNGVVRFYTIRPDGAGPYPAGRALQADANGNIVSADPRGQEFANMGCLGHTRVSTVIAVEQATGMVTGAGTTTAFICYF
ncbi:hypothetical protein [Actinomadura alba]|uniref:Secreted protein n=1 Tax=Actinomadura alba TaxID=406431 RepID=A0ABR7LW33_9ACTN|nr:hypothetical protein [Actinomadura alba]MBC6468685.1 hypothetical protein [Actinomadura alba]